MTWDNVELEKRFAHLPETKSGEARSVPLSPAALALLQEMREQRGDKRYTVFGMSADAITQAMEQARKVACLQNLHFRDLRHEAVSRLFENTDLDVMEIKTISGHRSMQMLARYSHLRAHRLADKLAGVKRGSGES